MDPQLKKAFKEINNDLDRLLGFALKANPRFDKYREINEIHKRTAENIKAIEFSLIRK